MQIAGAVHSCFMFDYWHHLHFQVTLDSCAADPSSLGRCEMLTTVDVRKGSAGDEEWGAALGGHCRSLHTG